MDGWSFNDLVAHLFVASLGPQRRYSWSFSFDHYFVQGVTLPPAEPVVMPSTFGFVENAEKLNSRAAMVRAVLAAGLLATLRERPGPAVDGLCGKPAALLRLSSSLLHPAASAAAWLLPAAGN